MCYRLEKRAAVEKSSPPPQYYHKLGRDGCPWRGGVVRKEKGKGRIGSLPFHFFLSRPYLCSDEWSWSSQLFRRRLYLNLRLCSFVGTVYLLSHGCRGMRKPWFAAVGITVSPCRLRMRGWGENKTKVKWVSDCIIILDVYRPFFTVCRAHSFSKHCLMKCANAKHWQSLMIQCNAWAARGYKSVFI